MIAARGIARARGKAHDLDGHHLAGLRGALVAGRDLDVHRAAAIERDDEAHAARVQHVAADDAAELRSIILTITPSARRDRARARADDHPVAVHGFVEIAAGDVDVALHLSSGRSGRTNA